jgi:hypothetical protein
MRQTKTQTLRSGLVLALGSDQRSTGKILRDGGPRRLHATSLGSGNTFAPSRRRRCASLTGSGAFTTASVVSHQIGSGDFTVCCWVNADAVSNGYRTIWQNGSLSNQGLYSTMAAGKWGFYLGGDRPSLIPLVVGEWTHILCRRRAGVLEFFTNSVPSVATYSVSTSLANAATLIGSESTAIRATFAGKVDEFCLYSRAVTNAEVRVLSSRPGILSETARRRSTKTVFNAYLAARKTQIIGGGF